MPRAFSSSASLVCLPSAETGEGRPLAGERRLAWTSLCSKSGSAESLLGTGVNDEPDVEEPAFLKRGFEATGLRVSGFAGNEAGEEVEGVFEKKPNSVLCPPEEAAFFNAGVDAGVAEPLLPILPTRLPVRSWAIDNCNSSQQPVVNRENKSR